MANVYANKNGQLSVRVRESESNVKKVVQCGRLCVVDGGSCVWLWTSKFSLRISLKKNKCYKKQKKS